MKRTRVISALVVLLVAAGNAYAQDSSARPARIEVTIIPGGASYFTAAADTGEPSFINYDAGAALAVNLNRIVAIEGELSSSLGISQDLGFATFTQDAKSPSLLLYAGNVVLSVPVDSPVVPFFTAGAGGVSIFDRAELVQRIDTFFAGNIGGGIKWRSRRWGLRADYRFLAVRGRDTQFAPNERPRPDFFGKEARFGHRVFGGITLEAGR
jgi:Outer membrane protein beta-barrel domain